MNVAIIGASPDTHRFSNKAVRAYLSKGYKVYPVNPNYEEVEGIKCYKNINDLPVKPDIINVYVNPAKGLLLARDIIRIRPKIVYLNPGSESTELIKQLRDAGLNVIFRCSIRAIGVNPDEL